MREDPVPELLGARGARPPPVEDHGIGPVRHALGGPERQLSGLGIRGKDLPPGLP